MNKKDESKAIRHVRYLNNQWENASLNQKEIEKIEDTASNVYTRNPNIKSMEIGNYSGSI